MQNLVVTLLLVVTSVFFSKTYAQSNKVEGSYSYTTQNDYEGDRTGTLKITRNYLAHLEEEHKEKSLKSEEIIEANILLEFVIREIFLREIGIIENSKIPSQIEKHLMDLNN